MSFSEPDTDILVPAFDVRALARRAAVPAALAAAAAAAIVVAGGPLHAFAHALRRALDADPRWVIGGAIFELLSFAGYVALFWMVGSRASKRLGLSESTQVTLGGAAATRLLPTAGVGGAAVTLWSLRRSGMGTREATRTLLGFLIVLYSVFLGAIALSGGAASRSGIASGDGPLALSAIPRAAATLAIAAALALGARRPSTPGRAARAARGRRRRSAPPCATPSAHVRSADPRLLGALAWWTFDAAGPVGDAPRLRRAAALRGRRARLLRGPGRQHDPDPGRRERRHRRRPRRLRRAGRPRARLGARLPRHRHLAARADRPRRARRAAPDDGALERRGRRGRGQAQDAAPAGPCTRRCRSRAPRARARSPRCSRHEAAPRHVAGAAGGARARPARGCWRSACSAPSASRW